MKKKSIIRNYWMLMLVWVCVFPLQAQVWEQMNGPYGGTISDMITDKNGSVCAATENGGLYVSNDYGNHWTERISEKISSLAVNKDGKLFAGSNHVIYTSIDEGMTWSALRPDEFSNDWIGAIAIDSSNRIYVGGYSNLFRSDDGGESWINIDNNGYILRCIVTGPSGVVFAGYEDGVYRSIDFGNNWSALNSGLAPLELRSLVITNSGNVLASTYLGGVFQSTIYGTSWKKVRQETSFCLVKDTAGNIFHGSLNSGIYKSNNEGETWIPVNTGLGTLAIRSLAVNSENTLYAGTQGMGIFRSEDQGLNWIESNIGLDNLNVQCLKGDKAGNIFAGSFGGGIQKSSDGGISWDRVAREKNTWVLNIEIDNTDRIFFSTPQDSYLSSDYGLNWEPLPFHTYCQSFNFLLDRRILAVTGYAIFLSDSSTKNWQKIFTNDQIVPATFINAISDSNNCIYAGYNYGIYVTCDLGQTWKPSFIDEEYPVVVRLFATKEDILFASVTDSNWNSARFYSSEDHGMSWKSSDNGMAGNLVMGFEEDIFGNLYAGTTSYGPPGAGVFRSTDHGVTWKAYNNGLFRLCINSLYIDTAGYLYAGTAGGDNFKKKAAVGNNMNPDLNEINFITSNLSDVITGSFLFRIKTGPTTAIEKSVSELPDVILEQNFPNPFSTTSTIRFNLAQSENVSLKIYNSLGQLVLNPVNGRQEAGLHEGVINGTEMPAGVYFYRMQTQNGSMERKFVVFK